MSRTRRGGSGVRPGDRARAAVGRRSSSARSTGRDYRLLVIGGRLVACAERVPAGVVGDGRRRSPAGRTRERRPAARRRARAGAHPDPHRRPRRGRCLPRRACTAEDVPDARPAGRRSRASPTCRPAARASTGPMRSIRRRPHGRAGRACRRPRCRRDRPRHDRHRATLDETAGAIIEVNAGPGLPDAHPANGRARPQRRRRRPRPSVRPGLRGRGSRSRR